MTWDLHRADCLGPEGLSTLADGSVAHTICDPPYAPRAMKNVRTVTMVQRRDGKIFDFKYAALRPRVRIESAKQMARVTRRWCLVFCDIETAPAWRKSLETSGLVYVRTGVWVRELGAPQFSGDRPAQGIEACVIVHGPERLRWNGGGRPATWIGPIVNSQHASREGHSTPKPEWLMEALIRDFTDPGELILDPFAGSGTTGVACIRNGRNFIGWERDAGFYETARKRLEATREQEVLFGRRGPKPKQGALL